MTTGSNNLSFTAPRYVRHTRGTEHTKSKKPRMNRTEDRPAPQKPYPASCTIDDEAAADEAATRKK